MTDYAIIIHIVSYWKLLMRGLHEFYHGDKAFLVLKGLGTRLNLASYYFMRELRSDTARQITFFEG